MPSRAERRLARLGFHQAETYSGPAWCEECGRSCAGRLGWYRRREDVPTIWLCKCFRCALADDWQQLTLFDPQTL